MESVDKMKGKVDKMKGKVLNHNLLSLRAWQMSSAFFVWAGGCFCALWLRIPSLRTSFPENLLTVPHVISTLTCCPDDYYLRPFLNP